MAIKTCCPHCDTTFTLADAMEGKKVRCKSCQEIFEVRAAGAKPNERKVKSASGANGANDKVWLFLGLGGAVAAIIVAVILVIVLQPKEDPEIAKIREMFGDDAARMAQEMKDKVGQLAKDFNKGGVPIKPKDIPNLPIPK